MNLSDEAGSSGVRQAVEVPHGRAVFVPRVPEELEDAPRGVGRADNSEGRVSVPQNAVEAGIERPDDRCKRASVWNAPEDVFQVSSL